MKKFLSFLLIFLLFPICCFAATVVKMPWQVHFTDGIVRGGYFTGQVENGVPHGYGVFTASIPDGTPWHYIGEWSNGIMHGDGLMVWESGYQQNGIFQNGEFISGTTVEELVFPDMPYVDLFYGDAGEEIAKQELLGDLTYVKTNYNYNFVNIYINLDRYRNRYQANIDACKYMLNVTEKLRFHPDVECVQCYFQCTDSYGEIKTAIIMKLTSINALKLDYPTMNELITKSIKSFAKELDRCEFMMGYQNVLY